MLKEVVVSLAYISGISDSGKDIRKTRRFNQVRLDLTDVEANRFKDLIASLTGEDYVSVEKIDTKAV